MMGLLGNVAEVQELRPRLMTQEFITVFSELLNSCSDGIEVRYSFFFKNFCLTVFLLPTLGQLQRCWRIISYRV